MKIGIFLCAQTVIADYQSKIVSVINILEDFTVASPFPIPINFSVYIQARKEEGDPSSKELFIEVKLGEKDVLARAPIALNFIQNSSLAKSIGNIGTLVIPTHGKLTVSLEDNGKVINNYEVFISVPSKAEIKGVAKIIKNENEEKPPTAE